MYGTDLFTDPRHTLQEIAHSAQGMQSVRCVVVLLQAHMEPAITRPHVATLIIFYAAWTLGTQELVTCMWHHAD